MEFIHFILERKTEILARTIEHIHLTGTAVLLSLLVGIPLGILLTRRKSLTIPVLSTVNIIQTIPSLALLGFFIPIIGIGTKPAILALFLYSLLAVVKNTVTGINQVDNAVIEAGLGMGMKDWQILTRIEIPLALPVIFSGIRIAAVTCIGIATLCAAVGAGGLGQFIFRGIAMVNNYMILAGALPAALLAILFDTLLNGVEKYLTPGAKRSGKNIYTIAVAFFICAALVIIPGIFLNRHKKDTIVIGSKNFTEQVILGEIMAQMIESETGLAVERKFNLGGTFVCFNALKQGEIDLYPEYTGTALIAILTNTGVADKEKVYQTVKKEFNERFNLVWLRPFGLNNTYALCMRKKQADQLSITSISDLKLHENVLKWGLTHEFSQRPDGYEGLKQMYGLHFKNQPREFDPGLMYTAVKEGEVDVISGFATDGRIPAYRLILLQDDKGFFPPYYAAPLVSYTVVERYPQVKTALEKLGGHIDDKTIRAMNYAVDHQGKSVKNIAIEFVKKIKGGK